MEEVKFTGCQDLDFSDNYRPACKLQAMSHPGGGIALFWFRKAIPDIGCPVMVQFCKKRGRLNDPEACLTSGKLYCSDYKEITHTVNVEESELES